MKQLHRPDLFCWTEFNCDRNIDFHSYAWVNNKSITLIDPLPLTQHDINHLERLGKITNILITNSDHIRHSAPLAKQTNAKLFGPLAEKNNFPLHCHHWLKDGDEPVPGLKTITMDGSKTPGELAFIVEQNTLITGDLIRSHEGGTLCLLPDEKLTDKELAHNSVKEIINNKNINAILPGDGWPIFNDGQTALKTLLKTLTHCF